MATYQRTHHVGFWPKRLTVPGLLALIFGIIGATFLIIGIVMAVNHASFRRNAVETTAVITEITEYHSGDDVRHTVHVRYEVNGITYDNTLNEYSSDMYVGGTITIYCESDNPQNVRGNVLGYLGVIFACVGGAFVAVAAVLIIVNLRKSGEIRRLMESGRREHVPISEIRQLSNVRINSLYPYIIICRWREPLGEELEFKSRYILEDPHYPLEQAGITTMTIYMDEDNPRKYHMDTTPLEELSVRMS